MPKTLRAKRIIAENLNATTLNGASVETIITGGAGPATTSAAGIAELATQAEVDAGTDTSRIVTPDTLANYSGLGGGGASVTAFGDFGDGTFGVTDASPATYPFTYATFMNNALPQTDSLIAYDSGTLGSPITGSNNAAMTVCNIARVMFSRIPTATGAIYEFTLRGTIETSANGAEADILLSSIFTGSGVTPPSLTLGLQMIGDGLTTASVSPDRLSIAVASANSFYIQARGPIANIGFIVRFTMSEIA